MHHTPLRRDGLFSLVAVCLSCYVAIYSLQLNAALYTELRHCLPPPENNHQDKRREVLRWCYLSLLRPVLHDHSTSIVTNMIEFVSPTVRCCTYSACTCISPFHESLNSQHRPRAGFLSSSPSRRVVNLRDGCVVMLAPRVCMKQVRRMPDFLAVSKSKHRGEFEKSRTDRLALIAGGMGRP